MASMAVIFRNSLHDSLDDIEQTSSVEAYFSHFEVIKSLVSSTRPEIYFADRFIYGLRKDIQPYVLSCKPSTVLDACDLACIYEFSRLPNEGEGNYIVIDASEVAADSPLSSCKGEDNKLAVVSVVPAETEVLQFPVPKDIWVPESETTNTADSMIKKVEPVCFVVSSSTNQVLAMGQLAMSQRSATQQLRMFLVHPTYYGRLNNIKRQLNERLLDQVILWVNEDRTYMFPASFGQFLGVTEIRFKFVMVWKYSLPRRLSFWAEFHVTTSDDCVLLQLCYSVLTTSRHQIHLIWWYKVAMCASWENRVSGKIKPTKVVACSLMKTHGWPPPASFFHSKYDLPLQIIFSVRHFLTLGVAIIRCGRILLHSGCWLASFGFASCDFRGDIDEIHLPWSKLDSDGIDGRLNIYVKWFIVTLVLDFSEQIVYTSYLFTAAVHISLRDSHVCGSTFSPIITHKPLQASSILQEFIMTKDTNISGSVIRHRELPYSDRITAESIVHYEYHLVSVKKVQSMGVDMLVLTVFWDLLKDVHENIFQEYAPGVFKTSSTYEIGATCSTISYSIAGCGQDFLKLNIPA